MRTMRWLFLASFLLAMNINSGFAQYTKLHDFTGNPNGAFPEYGDLYFDGTFLYGMTSIGGTADLGTIFKIKPDGTGYVKLLDFTGTANGSWPEGSLISDGTFLYGMTRIGGTSNWGTIFKIKPNGTGYMKLLDFTGSANGKNPYGSLISDGTFLYGMTYMGGTSNMGVVFKIKHDGTGYSKLLDFTGATNGKYPHGSLISDGTFLYGMTREGGVSSFGTIFKIKHDGTGYVKLLDFTGAANGKSPWSSLISDGTFLYGMTEFGRATDRGTIFKIKTDGTGFVNLLDFTGANGMNPQGSLFSDGTFLYGMTPQGGSSNLGALFKIKPDGTSYLKLYDFTDMSIGIVPNGSLISDGTFLYGMTLQGGTSTLGTVFKYKDVSTTINSDLKEDALISIYPNPSNGLITLNFEQTNTNVTYSITSVEGKVVKTGETSTNHVAIDLSNQPDGIYFMKINSEKKINSLQID
jgi:uncharacterized repeat protein (TIGR03803 family)